jgi:putative ABC transport system substrate-binding protein
MRRRDFITLAASMATVPLKAGAQQNTRLRTIGVMSPSTSSDRETLARIDALHDELEQRGWYEGRNIRFVLRHPSGNPELIRKQAAELVALAPDAIVVGVTPGVQALKKQSSTIPIVFANVADPVGSGLVDNMPKPGRNVTGFTAVEYAIVGKWLELLKEMAPSVDHVALLGNPDVIFTHSFYHELERVAPSSGIKPLAMNVRNAADIEREMQSYGRDPNGGLILVPEFTPSIHRALIIRLANAARQPVIGAFRFYAVDGAVASYGPDLVEQWRGAARYVDRILRGAKPGDLPVQAPTRFEFILNSKAARSLGITIPPNLLGRADEVIE